MADSKEQIKKDLTAIMKLDSQIDYSQKAAVEKYHKLLVQKNLLTTAVGKRYLKKLEQIINGEADYNKCLFCTKETQHNTVICPSCMAKSKQSATVSATVYCRNCGRKISAGDTTCSVCGTATGEGHKYCAHCGNKVPMPNIEYLANDVKNKSMDFAGQAAKIAKENVQNIAKQGEKLVGDITEDAKRVKKAKTDNPKEKKAPNKKGIILLIILILIAIGIVDTIGLGTIFEFFAMIALGSLIYKAVKKQPKKKAAIVFVILCVLSGLASTSSGSSIDFASKKTRPDEFLKAYEKMIHKQAATISDVDLPVSFELYSERDTIKIYQIIIDDAPFGSISFGCYKDGSIHSIAILPSSSSDAKLSAFIVANAILTIDDKFSMQTAIDFAAESKITSENDEPNRKGDYVYSYTPPLFTIMTKEFYNNASK